METSRYIALRRAALVALASLPAAAALAQVVAPPLPPGSDRVRIETGQSGEEHRRMIRAHRHNNPAPERRETPRDDKLAEGSRDPGRNEPAARR